MVRSPLAARRQSVLVLSGLLLLFVVFGWLFYHFGLEAFLTAAYNGYSLEYFNDFAARWRHRQSDPSYQAFVTEARSLLFRLGLLGSVVTTLVVGGLLLGPKSVGGFFSAKTSPYNLALLRVLLFGTLLLFDLDTPASYAQLPASLQFAPPGLESILPFIPLDSGTVDTMSILFKGACISGLLGFYSRTSAAIATLAGTYLLGIPQLYGKTIHYHHVIWFAGLLATSPAGDVLSIDAVIRGWRAPSETIAEQATAYARPIRFGWLLIGIIYFFPGFWKFASEGFEWALSSNLKYRMHTLWFSFDQFRPLFRLDRYPALYQGAALATMAFEIGVLFTLPFRMLRSWAGGAALLFHQSTQWFLNIYFWSLPPFLLTFFDLRRIAKTVAEVFAPPLYVAYDEEAHWQCRVVAVLRRFDLFDRLRFEPPHENESALSISSASGPALWVNGRLSGRTLTRLLRRVPTLLPLTPVAMFVPWLRKSTQRPETMSEAHGRSFRHWPVVVVGGILLSMNVLCGLGHVHSWPFSVYPTFAVKSDSVVHTIQIQAIDSAGHAHDLLSSNSDASSLGLSVPRLRGLTHSIMQMPNSTERTEKLQALWSVCRTRSPTLESIERVRFYRVEYTVTPPFQPRQPTSRRLMAQISV